MRRTKEDAQETRRRIIAAARDMFARRGVTRTSLEQVARAARVTRGAIYWHFANKTELFYAMREEVALPLVDSIGPALDAPGADPLQQVEKFLLGVIEALKNDSATRQTFEIIGFKCEYVSELQPELNRQIKGCGDLYGNLERAYQRARKNGSLREGINARAAALETCAFLSGLVRLWLLDGDEQLVRPGARAMIAQHVRSKRA
jgi:TetR/AcrR family acrAB operon transcriptional repressor